MPLALCHAGGGDEQNADVIKYNAPQGTKTQPCLVEMPDRNPAFKVAGYNDLEYTYVDFCSNKIIYIAEYSSGSATTSAVETIPFELAHGQDSVVIEKARKVYYGR